MKGEQIESTLFHLASTVQATTSQNDLVIAVDEGNPVFLYRCNRKGWQSFPEMLATDFLEDRKRDGAKYLVGEKTMFDTMERRAILDYLLKVHVAVANTPEFFILRLGPNQL